MINIFRPFQSDYDKLELLHQELLRRNTEINQKIDNLNKSIIKINNIGNKNGGQ